MENGAYAIYTPHGSCSQVIIVINGIARVYSMNWYGDLAEWEHWRSGSEDFDVRGITDPYDLVYATTRIQWQPANVVRCEWGMEFPADRQIGDDSPIVQLIHSL